MNTAYQQLHTYVGTELTRGLYSRVVLMLVGALASLALFLPYSASATTTSYIEFNDSVQSSSDLTTYTFTDVDLGTPAADRCVIVSAYGKKFGAASNLSSLTIGGESATIIDVANGTAANTSIVALAAYELPTGATSTIEVTWANSMIRGGIGVWSGYGLESCTSPFQVASSTASDPTANLDIPEGGVTVGAGVGDVSGTWSGLPEDFVATLEGSFTYSSGASDYGMATETDRTITIDYASGAENAGIFVSWAAAITSASEVGPSPIEYLLVAGGGGGGAGNGFTSGGGGGAGGLVHASFTPSITTYAILVGRGGTAASSQGTGENGNNSVLFGIGISTSTTFGGGGGGSPSGDGGSGGGGVYSGAGGSGTPGQGNDGGTGTCNGSEVNDRNSSGGGGAGEAGFGCVDGAGVGGAGGDGLEISITGAATYYAGGGGGGSRNSGTAAGGLGGGGNGARGGVSNAQSGTDGLGGGGGGNGGGDAAGDGGDGVVILRWLTADYSTDCEADGGSKTTDGSYTVCTFTTSGTLTVLPAGVLQGVLYNTDGTTPITTGKTIGLVVGTSTPSVHTTVSDSNGNFVFSNVATSSIAATTSLTIFIDGDANDATTLVQGYSGEIINGVPLRYGHVLTYASSSAASVELIRFAGYDRTNDADILFTASSSPASTTIFATLLPYQGTLVNTGTLTLTDSYIGSSPISNTGTIILAGTTKTLSGALTGSSNALGNVNVTGSYTFSTTASTSDLTIATAASLEVPTQLSVSGSLTNNGTYTSDPTDTLYLTGSGEVATGTLVAASALGNVNVTGSYTFSTAASTSDLTIGTAASLITPKQLTVAGTLTNNGTFANESTNTLYLTGTGEVATGTLVVASALGNVDVVGSYTFGAAASTSDLTIRSGATLTAPVNSLTINGDFTQSGTFTNNSGTQYFTGPNPALTGNFVGSNALGNTVLAPSSDATSWNVLAPVGFSDTWQAVTYGSSTFVAVATSNGDRVMYSFDGLTWATTSAAGNNDNWQDVTYGNGRFVAVGAFGDRVMHSTDGITWATTTAAGDNDSWEAVTYGNERFVAVGLGPDRVMHSADGITWTVESVLDDNDNWRDVIYADGKFVAVGSSGDYVMYSTDGINWTAGVNSLSGQSWNSVAYGNGIFVAVGDFGDRVATSPDGITWTAQSVLGDDESWNDVTFGNGYFVAVGREGDRVMRSVDGITWEAISVAGNNDNWRGVAYGDGMYVVVGYVSASDSLMVSQGSVTLTENASTTDFTITANRTVTASTSLTDLSITGNYTNNGTFSAGSSTVWFSGTSLQTATGTMTDTSAFYDLTIANTSGAGSSTQSITFNAPVETTGTFTMGASTSAAFLAGATSTFARINWDGLASESPVWLRSTEPGTPWLLDADTQVAVSYVNVRDSDATPSTGPIVAVQSFDAQGNTNWVFAEPGTLTLGEHTEGQANSVFSFKNRTDAAAFTFSLTPANETATVTALTLSLTEVQGLTTSNLTNFNLHLDVNNDGVLDGGDTLLSAGTLTLSNSTGTVSFTTPFVATTSQTNYLVTFNTVALDRFAALAISLLPGNITAIGELTEASVSTSGSVSSAYHTRNTMGGGGASGNAPGSIGGEPPAGDGDVGGGEQDGGGEVGAPEPDGENITPDPNFKRPSSTGDPDNDWTNPTNAYLSDGVSASAATDGHRQAYGGFGFNIPSGNQIVGIEVKTDSRGQENVVRRLYVSLSWDEGITETSPKEYFFTESDVVRVLGGNSDLWGRIWTPTDFSDTNFRLIIEYDDFTGEVFVDGLEVRVYHQAGGGGGGGGGSI